MHVNDQDRFSERIEAAGDNQAKSTSDFDEASYLPMLDGLDMAESQKLECLRILANIMRIFVDLDIPAETWGQITQAIIQGDADESSGIESN